MSDGLRWDYHPEEIQNMGTTFKTIASSLHTPTSIASMLTGRYLPNHGIRGFTDRLDADTRTILDAFPNAGLSVESGNFNNEIYSHLLDRYDRVPLSDIEEPFAWFSRDPGGHAPLDEFDEELETKESVRSYLKRHGGDEQQIRTDYANAINSSVARFRERVIETLRERDILDQTLVIFISDHGELLGEYGHVGESHPATPEIVRVPVTFVHSNLPPEESSDLLRHVDVPATIADLGGFEFSRTDGHSGFHPDYSAEVGLNFYDRPYPSFSGTFHYSLESVWDWYGGHVFNRSGLWDRVKLIGGYLTRIPAGIHLRRSRSIEGFRLLLRSSYSWGEPGFSRADAAAMLADLSTESREKDELEMGPETKENLKDLGYL